MSASPAETMADLLVRMGRQLSALSRRAGPGSSGVRPTTLATVQTRADLPPDASPGAGFFIIDEDAVVVRNETGGWDDFDPGGVRWTGPSYLASVRPFRNPPNCLSEPPDPF